MHISDRALLGWEASDPAPLTSTSKFTSLGDIPDPAESGIPRDPDMYAAARDVYEALGRIGELPGKCKTCPARFKGDPGEFKVSIIVNKGDGEDPEVYTICRSCYAGTNMPVPPGEDDHEVKLVRFMSAQGSNQTEIAQALGFSQPKVSRILKQLKSAQVPRS